MPSKADISILPQYENGLKNFNKDTVNGDHFAKYEKQWMLPDTTFKMVRDAVPQHCFERNTLRSLLTLAHDIFLGSALVYAVTKITTALAGSTYVPFVWIMYWIAAGTVMLGIWNLGHECGHNSFSSNKTVNTIVGLIVHSAVLTPYHSWRISHSHHHKNTGRMTNDAPFLPRTRSQRRANNTEREAEYDTPLSGLKSAILMILLGYPLYLIINYSGPHGGKRPVASHFIPSSALFKPHQYWEVVISDIGICIVLAICTWASFTYSLIALLKYYIVPYIVLNGWIVVTAYLQHTSPYLPHYRDGVWTFERGAALTIDRSYGFLLNHLFHHLTDCHVAHHFFPMIPHYHLVEVSEHVRRVLGKYYCKDDSSIWGSILHVRRECRLVEDTGDVVFYKKI